MESSPLTDSDGPALLMQRVADAGISMLPIPTPFAVGRVNAYLIEDEPLTLVDSGPNSAEALVELEQQLDAHGYRIEQLELVVITHQHLDHTGLVGAIAERSGAEVAGIDLMAPYLADYEVESELEDAHAVALMRRHGVPEDHVEGLRSVSRSFRSFGAPAQVTRPLLDGGRIELRDRTLEVQLRPGHSPTDTLFWDAERRILIAGDHLIGHISSNPLLSRPLDGSGERSKALLDYLASMRRTAELPAEVVLAGHGEPFTDHAKLIASRLAMHDRRAEKLLRLIEREPMTAHEMALDLWGNVAMTQAFLTLSEVIGHMDLLGERGLAVEIADGDVTRFASTAAAGNRGELEG